MDDWQESAFNTRHVHNRVGRSSGRSGRRAEFQVKRTFGKYSFKCPKAQAIARKSSCTREKPALEIFCLSDDGRGLLGSLFLPGALEANVVLAGSAKVLGDLVTQLEEPSSSNDDENDEDDDNSSKTMSDDDQGASEEDEPSQREDEKERQRFQNFEKNSFRSPKFWFMWKGKVLSGPSSTQESTTPSTPQSGMGYLVYSGNECRYFRGTISCDALGWKDVSMTGWKEKTMNERDVVFEWN
ncbi:hypothetical protein CPLU01_14243 [Colletotrichum plurivorum]|uniref:Uncharacterized protein n=1 Tax=Colletotrichum plurivorum TaxID=2175906 RepID=A0A8H6MZR0_9PEZI|nr:hypothetical protein CPLU01_14243 [Colletotrichum plurivorum]